jgi:hypothetical protein
MRAPGETGIGVIQSQYASYAEKRWDGYKDGECGASVQSEPSGDNAGPEAES